MTDQISSGYRLSDRYTLEDGTVFMSGLQALVRMPMEICRRDRRNGRETASFISGYEGSPLAGYDLELGRQKVLLDAHGIIFKPGLNEELAANGVQGSQLASASENKTSDGIVGIWYGKAPGLDRATDAFRHGNLGGADPNGGVLAIVGDDTISKSPTAPSSSEMALAELGMPTLSPSNPQEILDFGLHGIEMSRFSGLWVAMKIATNVADGSSTTTVSTSRVQPILPDNTVDGAPFVHEVSAIFLQPTVGQLESSQVNQRLELARRYVRANGLNSIFGATGAAKVGIVVAGATYLDLRQALTAMGLPEEEFVQRGIRILKLGVVFPVDREEIRSFASGLDEIVVVEEKRAFLEIAIKEALYGRPSAPLISGKLTPSDEPLLRPQADLSPELIRTALEQRLALHLDLPKRPLTAPAVAALAAVKRIPLPLLDRTPYFCSGCPHNRSTRPPEGSLVGAGIGCTGMIPLMPAKRVGNLIGLAQMGGEGGAWVGMAPFVSDRHSFQNMGDGTFHHSGSLAIRAAIASGANITYKILYNSAVAMTGGQRPVGAMSVISIVQELRAEGVQRIVITTEDPKRYRGLSLPSGVEVRHRDRMIETQEELAKILGCTVLIHDQECATELRRKRKRNLVEEPVKRAFISKRVCEGCGDCGEKSNCLSVQPIETEYGRKTQIHQASCNLDYSCLAGDCPSFLTAVPAANKGEKRHRATVSDINPDVLPEPMIVVDAADFGMRMTGIGGTGVVTVAQIISLAATFSGLRVQSLDQTGLAQKGGAVVSDVKTTKAAIVQANKVGVGEADLYLGCDLLVAAADRNLVAASSGRTIAVVSISEVPTGSMVTDTEITFPNASETVGRIQAVSRDDVSIYVDARRYTLDLFDDDQYANVFLVGIACQAGALPLKTSSIEEAITLNGVAVPSNIQAFRRGRQYVADQAAVDTAIAQLRTPRPIAAPHPDAVDIAALVGADPSSELARLVSSRANDLIAYQDTNYARDYALVIERVREVEAVSVPGSTRLAETVAQYLHKLMAYKDEYEVARLLIDPVLADELEQEFGAGYTARYQLHPPLVRALGVKRKLSLGSWFRPILVLLYSLRGLRHTRMDVFGYAKVRRVERELIIEYKQLVSDILGGLSEANVATAIELAELPDMVRGYEDIKLRNVERFRTRVTQGRSEFDQLGSAATQPIAG